MSQTLRPWMVLALLLSGFPATLHAQQDAAGTVAGAVYDSVAGTPLPGARVSLAGTDHVALTDSAGAFRIERVAPGEYGVTFAHPRVDALGLIPGQLPARVQGGGETRVELAIPSLVRLGAMTCLRGAGEPGRSIAVGRVMDAASGQPLPGARVAITWAGSVAARDSAAMTARVRTEAVADALGHWLACDLPTGAQVVARVDVPGYRRHNVPLRVDVPSAVQADFLLAPGARGDVAFLTGRVVSQADGMPLRGAVVRMEGTGLMAVASESGLWELENVPPGDRILRVRHQGAERALPVRVDPGGVMDVEVRMAPDAFTLAPVTVTAARNLGLLNGFYQRRRTGTGRYFTRRDIEQRASRTIRDLLAGVPQGRSVCGPLYFVDGMYVRDWGGGPGGVTVQGVGQVVDDLHLSDVEGVEYYAAGLQVPAQFLRGDGRCSVIAIWTKRGTSPQHDP